MLDYADPIVHIRLLTVKLQNQFADKKIEAAKMTLANIEIHIERLYDYLKSKQNI